MRLQIISKRLKYKHKMLLEDLYQIILTEQIRLNRIVFNVVQAVNAPFERTNWFVSSFFPEVTDFPACRKYRFRSMVRDSAYHSLQNG